MGTWLTVVLAALLALLVAHLPTAAALRVLGAGRGPALLMAPPLAAALAGTGAIGAEIAGLPWHLGTFLGCALVMLVAAWLLARCGIRLPALSLRASAVHRAENPPHRADDPPHTADGPPRSGPGAVARWAPWAVGLALVVAGAPILVAMRRPDAVLERWDTLYHLSALARIRATGDGSSRTLGILSNTVGEPVFYPAAFHDLASLMPAGSIPAILNGTTLALAVVPWVLGTAALAHVLWPGVRWAGAAGALGAALAPAAPLNEWIHLSPLPNLTGMAMIPGALTGLLLMWRVVLAGDATRRQLVAVVGTLMAVLLGLALLQPNVAVTLLILLCVLTVVTGAPHWRSRPLLAAVPVLALLPPAVLTWTPLGATVTNFSGGLVVPWWTALGEIVLGLWTVWPMALGVAMAALWWPGLIRTFRTPQRWVAIAWVVVAVLYLDAGVDSALDLSVLYYRGQDRLAMPLALLSVLLIVPGLQLLVRAVRSSRWSLRPVTAVLVAAAVLMAGTSVPVRYENASKNLAADYPGRGRFLQPEEREAFAAVAEQMDHRYVLLASPFSGASHMYALHGMTVRFPVAGMSFKGTDEEVVAAVPEAATSPEACQVLRSAHVKYIYQERSPYQWDTRYSPIEMADPDLGTVLFETPHSRLIEVDCEVE